MRFHFLAIICLLVGNAVADDAGVTCEENLCFGEASGIALKLDLIKPAQDYQDAPALILIHGGSWIGGDKSEMTSLAKLATEKFGYVCVTIDYRRVPTFRFPAQIEDCKCSVRWLKAHAQALKVDPNRIGALGISAGGYLAMMLGVLDPGDGFEGAGGWVEQSSKVNAVVSLFGPTTFIAENPPVWGHAIVTLYIGGTMGQRRDDYRRASPLYHVDKNSSPMLLFHGTKDDQVPYEQAVQMAAALTEAGVPGRVELLIGQGHHRGKHGEHIERQALEFLNAYLKK